MPSPAITVRITVPTDRLWLKQFAAESGRSVGEVVREAISEKRAREDGVRRVSDGDILDAIARLQEQGKRPSCAAISAELGGAIGRSGVNARLKKIKEKKS